MGDHLVKDAASWSRIVFTSPRQSLENQRTDMAWAAARCGYSETDCRHELFTYSLTTWKSRTKNDLTNRCFRFTGPSKAPEVAP